jgi:hypothetical protein
VGQDLSQVVPRAIKKRVDRIALHALEEVASEKPISFHMADLGLHSGSQPQVPFEGVAEFSSSADEYPTAILWNAMALVASIHESLGRNLPCEALHLIEPFIQRVDIVGIAQACPDLGYGLPRIEPRRLPR